MADGFGGGFSSGSFPCLLEKYIGETVTIFTSSGGQSGSGFTGVVLSVNECFIRLISRIGPPPGCSLGNACSDFKVGYGYGNNYGGGCGCNTTGAGYDYIPGPVLSPNLNGSVSAGGWNGYPVYTVGSVTDIPIAAIVSFVHNAV
jgi:hypothetical protein